MAASGSSPGPARPETDLNEEGQSVRSKTGCHRDDLTADRAAEGRASRLPTPARHLPMLTKAATPAMGIY